MKSWLSLVYQAFEVHVSLGEIYHESLVTQVSTEKS